MGVLGTLSLVLSGFLVVNTVNAVLAQQISQIGVMKAVGATARRVVRVYLVMVLIYGMMAVIVAVPLAAVAAQALAGALLSILNIEVGRLEFVPRAVVVQLAVGLVVPALAALWPVISGARITVRQAISTYGLGADFGNGLIDKLISHIRGLPRPLALSLRNTFRRKGRVALTQTTLIIAGAMFMGVMSTSSSLSYTLDRLFGAYNFDVWMILDNAQRFEHVEAVASSVPGVTGSEMMMVSSGRLDLGGNRKRDISFWGVLPNSPTFKPTMTAGRWLQANDQNVMVLNQKLAQDEGLKVGDRVNVHFGEGNDSTWEIVGLLVDINNQGRTTFVPRDTLARALHQPNQGSMIWITTDRHDSAYQDTIEKRLRAALEANSIHTNFSITSARNIQLNMNQFNILTSLLLTMSVLAGMVGSLGLMGTMSINVLERSKEIGVMRAIGARSSAIIGIFVVEGVILGLLSTVFSIPLSYPGSQLFSDAFGNLLLKAPLNFRYSIVGLFVWMGVIVVLSALASLWPAWRAARISVRETLAYE
jgi:putative ABC transport system permease protein